LVLAGQAHPLGVATALLEHRAERDQLLVRAGELGAQSFLPFKGHGRGEHQDLDGSIGKGEDHSRPGIDVKKNPDCEKNGLSEDPERGQPRSEQKPDLERHRNQQQSLESVGEQRVHPRHHQRLQARRSQSQPPRGAKQRVDQTSSEPDGPADRPWVEPRRVVPPRQD
jgi:hypothetical protein